MNRYLLARKLLACAKSLVEGGEKSVKDVNVPHLRQHTTYSCGPISLLSVLKYYKMDEGKSEADLIKLLGSSKDEGTRPSDMERVARDFGLKIQSGNMTVEDLQAVTVAGVPVVVAFQAWPAQPVDWEKTWSEGHYAVVTRIKDGKCYLQDSSLNATRGYIPLDEFVTRWHDETADKDKLTHWGMAVYGPLADNEIHKGIKRVK